LYYIVYMIFYEDEVLRQTNKGKIPKSIFKLFNNVFVALDITNDMNLFDIKKLKSSSERSYFRLRKNKYRAIFYIEGKNYYIINIAKREEVYKQWE
jgi:mRNA interferase RelE/StbE